MTTIQVPDVEPPIFTLCWKQAPNMVRCDRKLDHHGPHSWEHQPPAVPLAELEALSQRWIAEWHLVNSFHATICAEELDALIARHRPKDQP